MFNIWCFTVLVAGAAEAAAQPVAAVLQMYNPDSKNLGGCVKCNEKRMQYFANLNPYVIYNGAL